METFHYGQMETFQLWKKKPRLPALIPPSSTGAPWNCQGPFPNSRRLGHSPDPKHQNPWARNTGSFQDSVSAPLSAMTFHSTFCLDHTFFFCFIIASHNCNTLHIPSDNQKSNEWMENYMQTNKCQNYSSQVHQW